MHHSNLELHAEANGEVRVQEFEGGHGERATPAPSLDTSNASKKPCLARVESELLPLLGHMFPSVCMHFGNIHKGAGVIA